MARSLKVFLLVVMVVLAPLRAFAAVADCCMNRGMNAATPTHTGHDASRAHRGAPQDGGHEHCATCVESCASAALLCAAPLSLPAAARDRGIVFVLPLAASFVPQQLDRPPLAG